MKKISNLAVIFAAAALLCGISACDNTETITMKPAPIEMVGDPIVTDKAAIFQWKNSVANDILITRQAPGEEEVIISNFWTGWINNGFVDRVMHENLLKAGVEYTYRFYNKSDVSSARTTEYTLEKKYSCVERKVTFPSIAPEGAKLARITKEQVTISKSESNGKNYVSVYVDEKESRPWITINDKTTGVEKNELYDIKIGGVEAFEYSPSHRYEILIGKWYPEDDYEDDERYYDNSYSAIKFENFDLGSLKNIDDNMDLYINSSNDSFEVNWNGEKDSKYEVSLEAFDNKGAAVALKKSTIAAADIKNDAFNNYEVTGKLSDLIDLTKSTTVKTVKAILKETAKDGTVHESEDEDDVDASYTSYTKVYDSLYVSPSYNIDEDFNQIYNGLIVELSGANLPDTAKLYYKRYGESLYTEFKDGLKKAEDSDSLTATVSLDENYSDYNFKAVVTVDNKNWYDWEESKTEEVVEYPRYWQ